MNQRGGTATIITVILAALLGVSYLPKKAADASKSESATPAASSTTPKPAAVTPSTADANIFPSCERIRVHLHRFYSTANDTSLAKVPIPGNDVCGTAEQKSDSTPLSVAIAIVPNPVQTHLPLMFDRLIDSIQQAVQDSGFTFDTAWFPWAPGEKADTLQTDAQQTAELTHEDRGQPGIMVFRRSADAANPTDPYKSGVVVFVVTEQPTGGVNHAQFAHAVAWARALNSQALRIIGPTFSGSLASLQHELLATSAVTEFPGGIRIFSGANSAGDNVAAFSNFLKTLPLPNNAGGTPVTAPTFRTFFESDQLMTDRFLCYMQRAGYDLNYFAILSEDQTAYGEAPAASNAPRCADRKLQQSGAGNFYEGKPLYLYYPRDIANLRSAYEQQSIFAAGKQQAAGPSTSLKEDFSEPVGTEHDTVRTYAGKLSPQAQETMLFGIANVLASRNIEFVIIRSSNTLDQLFLAEFLRRSYPNGRIVIDGADLLFRRGMEGASLRGVMMLSTYPLLSWTRDAVPTIEGPPGPSYRVFSQDTAEGTYIAARELLKNVPGSTCDVVPAGASSSKTARVPTCTVSIADYATPHFEEMPGSQATHDEVPPTWLTVVGNRQFWPLAYLNDQTSLDGGDDHGPLQKKSQLLAEPNSAGNGWRKFGLPLELWALWGACLALAVWHWYCCSKGSIYKSPTLRAYFAPVPRMQHTVLIFIGSLILAFLSVNLWLSVMVPGITVLRLPTILSMSAVALAMFFFAYRGLIGNYRLRMISGKHDKDRTERLEEIDRWRGRLKLALVPSALLLGVVWYLYLAIHLGPATRVPLFWRTVYLRSGISGILPQVLLLVALYAWYWFNLHGMALFGDDRPRLPKAEDLPQIPDPSPAPDTEAKPLRMFLMFSREGSGDNIENEARPMSRRYRTSLKYFLPISYIALWIAVGTPILDWHPGLAFLPGLRTLGDIRFGIVIFFGVALCCGVVLADTFQLRNTWSQLRKLLLLIDRLRLRRTLATLRGLYGGSVWKLSGNLLEERYRLISRQFESMRVLESALRKWTPTDRGDELRREAALAQVEECETAGRAFAAWYVKLHDDDFKDIRKLYNITELTSFQLKLAETAGKLMGIIILPEWQQDANTMLRVPEGKDLEANYSKQLADLPPHVAAAEEFFLLPYMGFIQNILGRIRTTALSIVTVFIAMTLAVSSYPFDPLPMIGGVFLVLFAVVGISMLMAYAEMCRDATLSRIADTTPGQLGWDFWVKMVALGVGPFLGLLTTLFPSMSDFIVGFLQPSAQAIH